MVALCISYPSLCISSCYLVAPWMRSTTHLVFFLSLSLSLSLTVSSFSLSDSLFFLSLLTLSLPVFFGICLCVSGLVFSISVAFLPFRFSAFPRIHFTSLQPHFHHLSTYTYTWSLLHLYCISTASTPGLYTKMDYIEDTQNTAPDARETSKLSSSQKNDVQSVTKRYFSPRFLPFSLVQNLTERK